MIAMEVVGIVLLPVYFLYSAYLAKFPVVPKRFLRNRSVVLACLVVSVVLLVLSGEGRGEGRKWEGNGRERERDGGGEDKAR